jgi:hypothetical protein
MDEGPRDGGPEEGIYRAMAEDRGMPRLGASATSLGIRKDKDIVPDQAGLVHRPTFHPGGANGLSCAPDVQLLPRFALPVEWGGLNRHTRVWRIAESDLGPDLAAQEDTTPGGRRHISIGPARTMSFDEFVKAIEATRPKWQKVSKP